MGLAPPEIYHEFLSLTVPSNLMPELTAGVTQTTGLHPHIVWVLATLVTALLAGTVLRAGNHLLFSRDRAKSRQRLASLGTWWGLYLLLLAALLAGSIGVVLLLVLASFLGVREYSRLSGAKVADRRLWRWATLAIPLQYGFVLAGALGPIWTFIPVWVLFLLLVQLVVAEETQGFLESVGVVFIGLMLLVYLLSHAALIVTLPLIPAVEGAGAAGAFLYLVILTEMNDIAQALWGRRLGRHPIMPHVSPHKTWEGFLLGAATTVVLAVALAPLLTPFVERSLVVGDATLTIPYLTPVLLGTLIAIAGFLGDVTISAIKREMGVKDSGTLLPGMGGILDRIDSLTYTAPAFFYFVYIFTV